MRVFAIGDMHLEGGTGKTMDRFGDNWRDHDKKIFEGWDRIGEVSDLLLVVGDTSWAMRLDAAKTDLDRVGGMKGTKLLFKGNHDYWWGTTSKLVRTLDSSVIPVNGSAVIINRIAVAGTRGWTCPNDTYFEEKDRQIYDREVGRLETALTSLKNRRDEFDSLIVALHYPPVNDKHESNELTELIDRAAADACVYGHLHGESIAGALTGRRGATAYYLVSADAVDFLPAEIKLKTDGGKSESSRL